MKSGTDPCRCLGWNPRRTLRSSRGFSICGGQHGPCPIWPRQHRGRARELVRWSKAFRVAIACLQVLDGGKLFLPRRRFGAGFDSQKSRKRKVTPRFCGLEHCGGQGMFIIKATLTRISDSACVRLTVPNMKLRMKMKPDRWSPSARRAAGGGDRSGGPGVGPIWRPAGRQSARDRFFLSENDR